MGFIQIDTFHFKTTSQHFNHQLQIRHRIFISVTCFIALCINIFNITFHIINAFDNMIHIKVRCTHSKVCRIEFTWIMHFTVCYTISHHNICHCMRLRKKILDLITGFNIPFRHLCGTHRFKHGCFQTAFSCLAFTNIFHNFKGHTGIYAFRDQISHNIITRRNRFLTGFTLANQILRIVQPYISTMRIA